MGLLKHLLGWPVTGPLYLAEFSLRRLQETAMAEIMDEGKVKEKLVELQLELELGEIGEEEYAEREAELIARLREIRAWHESSGG